MIWNNRDAKGELNTQTLHHGTPVTNGFKCVVTKWFRSVAPVASYVKEANEYLPPLTRRGSMKLSTSLSLFESLTSFYTSNRHASIDERVPGGFVHSDTPNAPSVMIELTEELQRTIHSGLQPIVEAWCGHHVGPTFVYGIREYHRGSVVNVHRDRLDTHVASAIINVAQEVDNDWPLHIEDNHYRGNEVYLQPGEMVLYEGCRLAHGRPSVFCGERFVNVFVHFSLAD